MFDILKHLCSKKEPVLQSKQLLYTKKKQKTKKAPMECPMFQDQVIDTDIYFQNLLFLDPNNIS